MQQPARRQIVRASWLVGGCAYVGSGITSNFEYPKQDSVCMCMPHLHVASYAPQCSKTDKNRSLAVCAVLRVEFRV